MTSLIRTTLTVLLISAPGAVQAQETDTGATPVEPDIADWSYDALESGWSAAAFLGAEVQDSDGGTIGEVADLALGADGRILRLIVDTAEATAQERFAFPWGEVEAASVESVTLPFDEGQLASYSLFFPEVAGPPAQRNVWRITELLGEYAYLGQEPYGWVSDAIIGPESRIRAAVVTPDVAQEDGGPYALPFQEQLQDFAAGQSYYYQSPVTEAQLAELGAFDYERLSESIATAEATGATAEEN